MQIGLHFHAFWVSFQRYFLSLSSFCQSTMLFYHTLNTFLS
jgi:hypothetical protein